LPGQSGFRDPFIDDLVRRFVVRAETSHTIDSLLVGLSTTAYSIQDYVRGFPSLNDKELFKEFISQEEVKNWLQTLACNPDTTIYLIDNNPRFKNLRPYKDTIIETLASIPCQQKLQPITRPATWRVEEEEPEIYGEYTPIHHYRQTTTSSKKRNWRIRRPRLKALVETKGFIIFLPIWLVISYLLTYLTNTQGIDPNNYWPWYLIVFILCINYSFRAILQIDKKLGTSELGIWARRIIAGIIFLFGLGLTIMAIMTYGLTPLQIYQAPNPQTIITANYSWTSLLAGLGIGLLLGSAYLEFRYMRESGIIVYTR